MQSAIPLQLYHLQGYIEVEYQYNTAVCDRVSNRNNHLNIAPRGGCTCQLDRLPLRLPTGPPRASRTYSYIELYRAVEDYIGKWSKIN